MISIQRIIALALFMGSWTSLLAQNSVNRDYFSPFSAYGLGRLQQANHTALWSLGGIGNSYAASDLVNYKNPAGNGFQTNTTIDFGVTMAFQEIESNGKKVSVSDEGLRSFGVVFPISTEKRSTLSFGLLPYSKTGYTGTISTDENSSREVLFNYDGALTKGQIGYTFGFGQSLTLGLNVGYIFGPKEYSESVEFDNSEAGLNIYSFRKDFVRGTTLDLGLIYRDSLSKGTEPASKLWSIGLRGSFGPSMSAKVNEYALAYLNKGVLPVNPDTVSPSRTRTFSFALPSSFGVGFSLEKPEHWHLSADLDYQAWSQLDYEGQTFEGDQLNAAVGFAVVLDPEPQANTFMRSELRFGTAFTQHYFKANGNEVQEIRFSTGIGIPIRKSRSRLNLGVDYGFLGSLSSNLAREQYLGVNVGISISERWFVRRQYD